MSVSWPEILGFVTGAASVWLFVRQSVWAWPVGIGNSLSWLVLFWTSRLYLDAGLQVVYVVLGVVGWFWWARGGRVRGGRGDSGRSRDDLPVRRTRRAEALVLTLVGVTAVGGLTRAMAAVGDAAPLADASTTVVSLIAQFMLIRKMVESWWCWIAVDLAYVVMYSAQGLYLTAALQPLFIVMCVLGLRSWRASMTGAAGEVPDGALRGAVTP